MHIRRLKSFLLIKPEKKQDQTRLYATDELKLGYYPTLRIIEKV